VAATSTQKFPAYAAPKAKLAGRKSTYLQPVNEGEQAVVRFQDLCRHLLRHQPCAKGGQPSLLRQLRLQPQPLLQPVVLALNLGRADVAEPVLRQIAQAVLQRQIVVLLALLHTDTARTVVACVTQNTEHGLSTRQTAPSFDFRLVVHEKGEYQGKHRTSTPTRVVTSCDTRSDTAPSCAALKSDAITLAAAILYHR
jgi:hypothetical protein